MSSLDLAGLPDAIDVARRRLDAAGKMTAGKVFDIVVQALQVEAPARSGLQAYVALLSGLPPDLLKLACERVLRTHRFKNLPTPAEWFLTVREELEQRQRDKQLLEGLFRRAATARKLYPPRPEETRPPVTEESKQRVKALVDEALRTLGCPRE